jgi:glutamine---fructose-6-phosphate transaminase (isomerizing)
MSATDDRDVLAPTRGKIMSAEMAEQPAVLRRILTEGGPAIRAVAAEIAARNPRFVLLTARGTSDNAALYAKYLIEVLLGKPAGLTSMSTTTAYGAEPDLRDCLVITVSQSGGSPDLVASTEAARKAGAITLAVTNNPHSALAAVSEFHIDVLAGPEKALPATKTYTAELLALYLLFGGATDAAAGLADAAAATLAGDGAYRAASRYRYATQLVTTARGYSYATAREAALKLMETSYLSAQAFSGADLLHGPLAMIDRGVPVIAVTSPGPGADAMAPVLDRLASVGADVLRVGDPAGLAVVADGVAAELLPILEILPLQQLAWRLALDRGEDPDEPRGLAKVTSTR